ncbi:OmpA family protein [Ruegeria sp. 2012CJ41-6]|uniref:OmpA family protein n=1 Tax=Ruegeria spongiae TaxID=2942209 RepID=A0ABT0PXT7_9RHOB|nr:OmpA family protein [Ruegeria spongiae]MCL6282337.1 OmpA family protein [Ruegeria spongiae]
MNLRALFLCLCAATAAQAQVPILPDEAHQVTERIDLLDSYDLPVGVISDGVLPVRGFEGRVDRRAWRLTGYSGSTLQVIDPIRAQLIQAGYEIVLDCVARTCGGFDFRFATEVIPAPDMYVTLEDFRFLSAIRKDEAISVLVSRTRADAYVQVVSVTPAGRPRPAPEDAVSLPETEPQAQPDLISTLTQTGHAVLSDLEFATGSSTLSAGSYASLAALAEAMQRAPEMRVAIVGHTDTVGQLNSNIALSKRRAEAVRDRLLGDHGIAPGRVDAEGMGYLSPLTTNLTPEGRETNRRVVVMLLQP